MKVTVAGTGYVGLVTGVCLASVGHFVTCVDVDADKIAKMNKGIAPIYEKDLEEMMRANQERLTYTTDYQNAYANAEIVIVGVGTPERQDGSANLTYLYKVIEQITESVLQDCLVVIKSTVPMGTNDRIEKYIQKHLGDRPIKIDVVSNPEFLSQGTAVYDTLHGSRIVIGVESKMAERKMRQLYEKFTMPIVVTDRRSAEMIKYASNDFLALKISYMNEIANVCELVGANIEDVAKGMGYDSRIGSQFLNAGIGYGGSCFPKDTKALSWFANFHDYEIKTIKAAIEVNEHQKLKLLRKARKRFDEFANLRIAVLGLTFKPGTDDLRDAPSLANIPVLLEEGAQIVAWDPVGMDNFQKLYPTEIQYATSIEEALEEADLCFIFTEWQQIKRFPIEKYPQLMKSPVIYDGRNCYSVAAMKQLGVEYISIGRP